MLTKTKIILSALAVAAITQGAAAAEAINPDVSRAVLVQQQVVSPATAQAAGAYAYAPVVQHGITAAEQGGFDRVTGNIGAY